jgi:hypothetical protein
MSQALYPDPPTAPEAAEASRPQPGPGADPGVYPRDLDELHARLVRWFEECELTTTDGRRLSQRDRDYVSGYQWTREELEALKLRGQPDVTINYCSRKVQLMCGLERKSRTDPKAFSRNPSDDDKADAATQGLRYIADDNDFPVIRSAVYENLLVEGVGGAELGLEDDGKGGADITITQVPYDRLFWDIHSRRWDFSDARYKGIVIWMDRDQADEMWPEARDLISDTFSGNSGVYGGYGDRPDAVVWTDSRRERVRVVQIHWDERNVWWTATLTRVGFLAEPSRSPFLDDRGKSASGLIMASAYIDRENNRFGMVRDLISEQDEINKRRSKALHLLSVKQVVLEDGAVTDVDKARREIARPDGMVVVNPGFKFEIADGAQLAEGQFKLLQHATAEMQASGPNASMSGSDPRELSGRAILAQQAGGSAQNEPIADALRLWSRKVYAIAWMAARQYWTAGRWVRITDDLGTTKYVGINQPVRLMDELAGMPEQQRAVAMQRLQIVPGDPRLEQVIRVENDIGGMDIDITIEEGIDVPSIQAEQFQVLIQLAGTQPGLIPPEILIAASNLRNKDQLLQQLKEHQQAAAQQQQVVQKMAQDKAQADITATQGKAAADFALAKERQHASVHHIADMHQGFVDMSAPPDPPADPGTVVPPEVQQAMDGATLRQMHAKAAVDEAKLAEGAARTNDIRHQTVQRINDVMIARHNALAPPGAPPDGAGGTAGNNGP